jgi:signal transduction histidine kinase
VQRLLRRGHLSTLAGLLLSGAFVLWRWPQSPWALILLGAVLGLGGLAWLELQQLRQTVEELRAASAAQPAPVASSEAQEALCETLEVEQILLRVLRGLEHILPFDSASVFLLQGDELQLAGARGLSPDQLSLRLPLSSVPLAQSVLAGQRAVVADGGADVAALVAGSPQPVQSWLGAPLRVEDELVGLLAAHAHTAGAYSERERALLGQFASRAAVALNNGLRYTRATASSGAQAQLLALTRAVSAGHYLPEILLQGTGAIAQATGASDVNILLLDESETHLMPQAGTSAGRRSLRDLWPLPAALQDEPLLAELLRAGKLRELDFTTGSMDLSWLERARALRLTRLLALPLSYQGQPLGLVLARIDNDQTTVSAELAGLVDGLASLLALAIAQTRLFERARRAAILEERSRLARELHDSVTQELFSINLTAQAASGQIGRNPERAVEQLTRLQQLAQHALGEMRDLLRQLRPTPLREGGLVQALRDHISQLGGHGGPAIALSVTGAERPTNGRTAQLYHIVQEALSNVIRHAEATEIELRLHFGDQLRIEICDNGRGFEPALYASPGRHLGLRTMTEQAAEIGGLLQLQSRPGAGTTVVVEMPLERRGVEASVR